MRKCITLLLLLISVTCVAAGNSNSDSLTAYIIEKGREQLKEMQAKNALNEAAGRAGLNEYVVNVNTIGDPKVEAFDREFIKQRRLTYDEGTMNQKRGEFFIPDTAQLNKLNEDLRSFNNERGMDFKTYVLIVDFVPLSYPKALSHAKLKDLLNKDITDAETVGITRNALNYADSILNGISGSYIQEGGAKVLFCGFFKFRVFISGTEIKELSIYTPNNNVESISNGPYHTILRNYVAQIKFQNGAQYVSDFISAMKGLNNDHKNWPAVQRDILQINSPTGMDSLLAKVSFNTFDLMTNAERIHILKVLSSTNIFRERELLINQVLESTPADGADSILNVMQLANDMVPATVWSPGVTTMPGAPPTSGSEVPNPKRGKCLLRCLIEETHDATLGFWGPDNYKRMMRAFISLTIKSAAFQEKVLALSDTAKGLLPERTIYFTYNSFWTKIGTSLSNAHAVSNLRPVQPKIDRNSGFSDCDIKTSSELYYAFFWPNTDLNDEKTLHPFEPIVFVNNSDLGMLADLTGGQKMLVTPAIVLKYADDKALAQTATDATMAAIDAVSLLTGYGEIKMGITGLRKAFVVMDMINSGVNLTLNVTGATENETVRRCLNAYNAITAGVTATRIISGGVKKAYSTLRNSSALNIKDIENLVEEVATSGDDLQKASVEDLESIKKMLVRIQEEAAARNLTTLNIKSQKALEKIESALIAARVPKAPLTIDELRPFLYEIDATTPIAALEEKGIKALFRGTTRNTDGTVNIGNTNSVSNAATSTSTDPVVATVFAIQGVTANGTRKGILEIVVPADMKGVSFHGCNARYKTELEVIFNVKPEDFSTYVKIEIPLDDAKRLVKEITGHDLPTRIHSVGRANEIVDELPKTSLEDARKFYLEALKYNTKP